MKIVTKYCGACNPEIDLAETGRAVVELVQRQGWQLVAPDTHPEADVLVLLCGCSRTCVDREELRRTAKKVVLVAGKRLGWQPIGESVLPLATVEAVKDSLSNVTN